MRIRIKIIFHLSKLWKAKFSLLCDVIFLVRLEGKFDIDHSWEWKGYVCCAVITNTHTPTPASLIGWPQLQTCQSVITETVINHKEIWCHAWPARPDSKKGKPNFSHLLHGATGHAVCMSWKETTFHFGCETINMCNVYYVFNISKIRPVVYHQCSILIGWATTSFENKSNGDWTLFCWSRIYFWPASWI